MFLKARNTIRHVSNATPRDGAIRIVFALRATPYGDIEAGYMRKDYIVVSFATAPNKSPDVDRKNAQNTAVNGEII